MPKVSVERRVLLRSLCRFAGTTAFVSLSAPFSILKASDEHESLPRAGDLLVFAKGNKKGQVINPDDLVLDAAPVLARSKDSVLSAFYRRPYIPFSLQSEIRRSLTFLPLELTTLLGECRSHTIAGMHHAETAALAGEYRST